MFRNIFGGKQEPANPKPQEQPGATIGDIFYDAAVEAARGAPQPTPGGFPALDSDVFLNEQPGQQPGQHRQPGQPHTPGQPHMPGQVATPQHQPPQHQQQGQHQRSGPQVFIPQGYQTPAQLRAKYDQLKERRNKIMARLRAASETDASKNPYASQGANGQVGFDNARHNRDQLDFSTLETEMRETWSQITEAERSAGEVTEQIRKAANGYFQQQFAGRSASQDLIRTTGSLFAKHVAQLIRSGFLLDANNLAGEVLNSHFNNVFHAALGEATIQVGSGLGQPGTGRPAGQTDSDPEHQQEDPYADFPEESKKIMAAFHRSQGMKPKTVAEAARMDREKLNKQQGNGGAR